MNETHLSVFHSISNHARKNSVFSLARYAFNSLFSLEKDYEIHVTGFDWFLRRKGDSTELQ